MRKPWSEVQQDFRTVVLRRGASTMGEIAAEIPVCRDTVYRLMRCEVQHPTLSLRAAVERYLSEVGRSPAADTQE